jgi:hypothetical protein
MTNPHRRPSPEDLAAAEWFKSSASSANGGCLEIAFFPGWVALRDNEDPANPPFVVTDHVGAASWTAPAAGSSTRRHPGRARVRAPPGRGPERGADNRRYA